MTTRRFSFLLILSLISMVGSSVFSQGPPATLVVTDQVKNMEFYDQITLVGRTQANRSGQVVAEVQGRVITVNSSEGVAVSKGTALVTIDSRRLRLSLEAKDAEMKRAAVQNELATTLLSRAEELIAKNLLSESTLDSARANAAAAEESHRQLKAERNQLALDVENCTVRAPYNGYTGRQLVNVGEWVRIGLAVYEMIDPSEMKVIVDLPERKFGHLRVGSEVSITISGDIDNPIAGTVTGISPAASQTTHTFPVIVKVDNKEGRLGGGMLVRATLYLNERFSSLAVSKDAIVRQGTQTMIYTIVDGKAAPITVYATSTNGTMIAVKGEGLSEGMSVVVRGNERIFPGSPVRQAGDDDDSNKPDDTDKTDAANGKDDDATQ